MQTAICLLSVVPLRNEPSHRSEMVSQLLFGEYVTIINEKDDFLHVICLYDAYEGWVQANQLTVVPDEQILLTKDYLCVFHGEVFIDGRSRRIPFGAPVYGAENPAASVLIGSRQIQYKLSHEAIWHVNEKRLTRENLDRLVRNYLDVPYLWGGKSVYGTDCSGFVQQVFKLFGVTLLRDAYMQAGQGSPVNDLKEAETGDLVFFQNEKGSVTHVGILMDQQQITHASGTVRIDDIDMQGILAKETKKRTHHFHSIRRVISR